MYTQIGEIQIDDETMVHARETEETVCVDIEYNESHAYTYINKEKAKRIVDHLNKVFNLAV
jgi:hypothetical protein